MATVQTRVGPVSYSDDGAGPVLVALHAALHDRHDFDPIVPALARSYRVVAVDWPGHGESPPPRAPFAPSAALYADVLEDVVSALELPPAVFVGNSVGGFAAARLALTQPRRVAGLVLVDTGGFLGSPLTNAYCRVLGIPAVLRRVLPRFVRSYLQAQSSSDNVILHRVTQRARTAEGVDLAAALWRSFAAPEANLRARAGQISAPTLIVWGAKDAAIPLRFGRATHRAIPGSRLEVLPTGHLPFSSQPERFLDVVGPFLVARSGVSWPCAR
jgi:pimeloyl-ACP methyl ester carboxylesterase